MVSVAETFRHFHLSPSMAAEINGQSKPSTNTTTIIEEQVTYCNNGAQRWDSQMMTIPVLQHAALPIFHNSPHSNHPYSNNPFFLLASPHIRHSRMLLSLDFPRDGEVLEPSGIWGRWETGLSIKGPSFDCRLGLSAVAQVKISSKPLFLCVHENACLRVFPSPGSRGSTLIPSFRASSAHAAQTFIFIVSLKTRYTACAPSLKHPWHFISDFHFRSRIVFFRGRGASNFKRLPVFSMDTVQMDSI
jgi:hypothetical protein